LWNQWIYCILHWPIQSIKMKDYSVHIRCLISLQVNRVKILQWLTTHAPLQELELSPVQLKAKLVKETLPNTVITSKVFLQKVYCFKNLLFQERKSLGGKEALIDDKSYESIRTWEHKREVVIQHEHKFSSDAIEGELISWKQNGNT